MKEKRLVSDLDLNNKILHDTVYMFVPCSIYTTICTAP